MHQENKFQIEEREKKCKTSNFVAVNFSRTRIKTGRNSWVSLIGHWSSSDKL